jgi:hypothetical protein
VDPGAIRVTAEARHPATATWVFPPATRAAPPPGIDRVNLRELVARPDRFEHHLAVCAQLGVAQLEIVTASEPLYFAHVNISDEYAVALPTGDVMVDHFPIRTFVSDPRTNDDVARYNHRAGDLVLHPVGFLHWPGRLRPPYAPLEIPPGMRRCGLSLVYCANQPVDSSAHPVALPAARAGDVKAYVTPAPPLQIAPLAGAPGVIATIGTTQLELVERPAELAPARGGWVVVIEGESPHAACDLLRIPAGARLPGTGILRALVLSSSADAPSEIPPIWREVPAPPFAVFEDGPRLALPVIEGELRVDEVSPTVVAISIQGQTVEVPRYWLARMVFRLALHGLRLAYVETYGRFFVNDAGPDVVFGLQLPTCAISLSRVDAMALLERLYRAVAPAGYRERLA